MSTLMRHVKRWWRSRGHGVHSPFAFRFITGVLRENAPYYEYGQLEPMPDADWLKLLFRLVCEFEPVRIEAVCLTPSERRTINLADSRVVIDDSVATPYGACIVMRGCDTVVMIERNVAAADTAWPGIVAMMTSGMTFTNGHIGIAVVRHDLPRQDFDINF